MLAYAGGPAYYSRCLRCAGWFTHAGAATGTRVIAYELQPRAIPLSRISTTLDYWY